jgi:hypothetical protein
MFIRFGLQTAFLSNSILLQSVFLKQKETQLYRPAAFYSALVITNIPFAVAEVFIMTAIACEAVKGIIHSFFPSYCNNLYDFRSIVWITRWPLLFALLVGSVQLSN